MRVRGRLQESRDRVAIHYYPVLIPDICLVKLPLLLVDKDSFQTPLQAFVDVFILLQVIDLLQSI